MRLTISTLVFVLLNLVAQKGDGSVVPGIAIQSDSAFGAANLTKLNPNTEYRVVATFDQSTTTNFESRDQRQIFKNDIFIDGFERTSFLESGTGGNKVLRASFPSGCVGSTCGLQLQARFDDPAQSINGTFAVTAGTNDTDLWMSYSLRLADNFDFVKSGILPGFCGGGNICMTQCGGKVTSETGWSHRFYWNSKGELSAHLFHVDHTGICGDNIKLRFTDNFDTPTLIPGKWHTLEVNVVVNTGSNRDGKLRIFFDQREALFLSNIAYTTTEGTGFIDKIYLAMFHGGSTEDYAPSIDTFVDYDAFFVSTERLLPTIIVPAKPSVSPMTIIAAVSASVVVTAGVGALVTQKRRKTNSTKTDEKRQTRWLQGIPSASSITNRVASMAMSVTAIPTPRRRKKQALGIAAPPPGFRTSHRGGPSRFTSNTDGANIQFESDKQLFPKQPTPTRVEDDHDDPNNLHIRAEYFTESYRAMQQTSSSSTEGSSNSGGGGAGGRARKAKDHPAHRGPEIGTKSKVVTNANRHNRRKEKSTQPAVSEPVRSLILSGNAAGCKCGQDKLQSVKLDELSWVDAVKLCQGYQILAQGTREELVERIKSYSREHFGSQSQYACRSCMTSISPGV